MRKKTGRRAKKVKLSCRLLELPRELRDEIYSWVLSSTRITFGEMPGSNRRIVPTVNKSRPYSLSLLYTCKQIKREIGSKWIGWVLFNFELAESLLDMLTKLPKAQVAAIRHIRVNSCPIMLSLAHDDVYYRLAWTLKLVPHLQLDTLTVLGGSANYISGGPGPGDYKTLDDLVAYGTGWKELHYITPNSSILSFPKTERYGQMYLRKRQPDAWRSALSKRDGPDSGASVMIYRSRTGISKSILNHRQNETFEQIAAPPDLEEFAVAEDPYLTAPNEQGKEVLVVVKRGRGANIMEEVTKPPYDQNYDIRALAQNLSWSQIREGYTEGGGEEDEDYGPYDESDDDEEEAFGRFYYDGEDESDAEDDFGDLKLDKYGNNAYEIKWPGDEDPEIAAGGGRLDDWDEHTAADFLRSRFVDP